MGKVISYVFVGYVQATLALMVGVNVFDLAMQMSFIVFLPSVLLSGFMFHREAMPLFFYGLGYPLPLAFFLKLPEASFSKGLALILY